MNQGINPGKLVKLRSGGPIMTVSRYYEAEEKPKPSIVSAANSNARDKNVGVICAFFEEVENEHGSLHHHFNEALFYTASIVEVDVDGDLLGDDEG